jgi:hypothetical protein
MNKPSESRVREAVAGLFNIQPAGPGDTRIDTNIKTRTLLHQWPLSRVERLVFRSNELPTLILKVSLPPLDSELTVYRDILSVNLGWSPVLYGFCQVEGATWLFLQDVGTATLKSSATPDLLSMSVSTLAGMHIAFTSSVTVGDLIRRVPLPVYNVPSYLEGATDALSLTVLMLSRRKYTAVKTHHITKLEEVISKYRRVAETLAAAPLTLVHGDFDADNIAVVASENRVIFLDWANACYGSGILDLVEIANFATNYFGPEIMPRVLQTYRQAYRAISGESIAAESMEEMFLCAQIEKKMSLIRWFNMCALRYIPSGVAAYDSSVSGLIDEVYELSTTLT